MHFTGERFVPSLSGEIKYEHLHRYALSLAFVKGKSVLDLASGEGYGSAALAKVAKAVTGVDIDPQSIEHAKKEYSHAPNLEFVVGSCEAVPMPDQSVDVVTSFETIEHHDKHEEMMLEIKRVLRPDGILIISSPNRLIYSDKTNYSNPYHVKELYLDEFEGLLKQHFKIVKIYGQKLAAASFIFSIRNEAKQNRFGPIVVGRSDNTPDQMDSPVYFIAICSQSNNELNEHNNLETFYFDESDDLLADLSDMRVKFYQTNAELERAKAELESLRLQLASSIEETASMRNSPFWKVRSKFVNLLRP